VRWGDGTPLTSADVAFTWSLLRDPRLGSPLAQEAERVHAVDTPDDKTVVLHYLTPQNPLWIDEIATVGVLPEHVLKDVDPGQLRAAVPPRIPMASCPFAVQNWDPGELLVLGSNKRALAGTQPLLDNVVYRVIPDYATRVQQLEQGSVDFVTGLDVRDAARLQGNRNLTVLRQSAATMRYVGYDLDDPRFSDPRVRRALTLGVDRERLLRDTLTEQGTVYGRYCIGTISPSLSDWFASDVVPLPYDPSQAIRLLE